MKISVVICTYNRANGLIRALRSLLPQTLDKAHWNILIVNNSSTDNTVEEFDRFTLEHPNSAKMRIVSEIKQGLSHARNRAIQEVGDDFIIYIDDDQEVSPNFVEAYYDRCNDKGDMVLAGGPIIPVYEGGKPKWVSKYVDRTISGYLNLGSHTELFPKGSYPTGGNMGIGNGVFKEFGGFSTDLGRVGGSLLGGEESDFFNRVANNRSDIIYVHDADVYHHISKERATITSLRQISRMVGVSERIRTSTKKWDYIKRLIAEEIKWWATLILALIYTIKLSPDKGKALILMRWEITMGLLDRSKK